MKATISVITPLMLGALGLSGCVIAENRHNEFDSVTNEVCHQDCLVNITLPNAQICRRAKPGETNEACRLEIVLPDNAGDYPEAPQMFRIEDGLRLEFVITGPRNSVAVLSFEKPVLRIGSGPWFYTVRLTPGSPPYTVRPYRDGYCHAPDGCKYVIINLGNPTKPSWINSPGVIIDPF